MPDSHRLPLLALLPNGQDALHPIYKRAILVRQDKGTIKNQKT
nr:MAG TPA: hypothetical protein [Caudoviricetes sp.]